MKTISLCTLLLVLFSKTNAQNIEGVWQFEDSIVGSMSAQNYRFFSENKFEYRPNAYDGLNVVYAIGGTYSIKDDTIFFTVEFVEECLNGTIERSPFTTLNDSWSIVKDCELRKRIFKKKETWNASFKISDAKNNRWLEIDGRMYYLLSNN